MVVKKNKGLLHKESNKNHVSMCLRWILNKLLQHVGNKIKPSPMFQAGLIFTLQCATFAALVISGSWGYVCVAIQLPNPFRAVMIWGLLTVLGILVSHYNPQGRC